MKKKKVNKISVMLITMLLIPSVFGNVVGGTPDLLNMSIEEIILYVNDTCMQDPPDRFVDGLDGLPIQQPISYGSRPIVYEAPWSIHDVDWVIDLLGVATESHNGEADQYQAWTSIYTSTGPLFGWAQVTAYAFQGIVFNPPVTDTYSITFDYTVQGFIEGAISDPFGTAEGEVALWFKTNTEDHKEDIITHQTWPPLFYSYNDDFNETLTVSMQDEMYEDSFEWIEAEAGQQDTSFAELTCWSHAQGALDDRGQQGWGDGAVLNSITIDWPNHPPETPETPDGQTEGEVGIEYTYSTRAFDPDDFGDSLWYKWDWEDGNISDWIGPYSSGELASASHTWTVTRDYDVKVKVKDSYDEESDWSSALTVSITSNNPPYEPTNPYPGNGGTGISITADLSWTGGDPDPGDTVTYDVYFGTTNPPPQVSWGQSSESYEPGTMNYFTKYYWKIVATDNHGESTEGPLWDFTTQVDSSNNPPELYDGYVNPTSGHISEEFIFGVTYSDSDGDWPDLKNLHVIKEGYHLTSAVWILYSGDPESGAEYGFEQWPYSFDPGDYEFYFVFNDGHGHEVRCPESGTYNGPHIFDNYQPTLTYVDDVSPDVGDTAELFTYEVEYTDLDGDPPTVNKVYISDTSHTMSLYSGDYETGAIFRCQTTLPPGDHEYYFFFNDGHGHDVRLPSSGTYYGPEVYPEGNQPPNTPTVPAGPLALETLQSGNYSTSAVDPEGHLVQYRFDWNAEGSHDYSDWSDPDSSGHVGSLPHSWNNPGTYVVKAQARDQYRFESDEWSDGSTVEITGEDSWSMFGHDPSQCGYSTSPAPSTNYVSWSCYGVSPNAYTYESSPAIVDGKLYTTSSGSPSEGDYLGILCFDADPSDDGIDEGIEDPPGSSYDLIWNYNGTGGCYSNIVVAYDKVYAASSTFGAGIFCVDSINGEEIWNLPISGFIREITYANDNLYFHVWKPTPDTGFLYCVNPNNGNQIWCKETSEHIRLPAIEYNKIYYASIDNNMFYCIDANTGDDIWSYPIGARSSPAVYNGKVYFGPTASELLCLDAYGNGDGTTNLVWSYSTSGWILTSPAIADDRVYFNCDDYKIYCLNATDGGLVWTYDTEADFRSSPVVADGKIYVGAKDNNLYCLNATDGNLIWTYQTPSYLRHSPAVYNNSLYIVDWGRLYCYKDTDGNHRPDIAKVDGAEGGQPLLEHTFTASTTDLDGDDILYLFDWGNGDDSGWLGPYASGEVVVATNRWIQPLLEEDTYMVKVKAKDIHDFETDWSDPHEFTISIFYPYSCFLEGTQITMADGSYKNIEKIKVGDMVLSCDRFNSRTMGAKVTKVYHHPPEEMTDYYLIINDNLRVTPNHPLYINKMWKNAGDARAGDRLLGSDGKFVRIESIEKVVEQVPTFSFDIDVTGSFGVYTYLADGALVCTKLSLDRLALLETMMQEQTSYGELLGV